MDSLKHFVVYSNNQEVLAIFSNFSDCLKYCEKIPNYANIEERTVNGTKISKLYALVGDYIVSYDTSPAWKSIRGSSWEELYNVIPKMHNKDIYIDHPLPATFSILPKPDEYNTGVLYKNIQVEKNPYPLKKEKLSYEPAIKMGV